MFEVMTESITIFFYYFLFQPLQSQMSQIDRYGVETLHIIIYFSTLISYSYKTDYNF